MAKVAGTSLVLGMIQAWRMELAAGNRTIERALDHLGSAEPHLQTNLLSALAYMVSCSEDATTATSILEKARALQKGTEGQRIALYNETHEAICRLHFFQWEQAVTGARRAAGTYRAMGDLWDACNAEWIVGWEMFLGRTAEAAEYLPAALTRAHKVGHYGAVWLAKWLCAWLSAARGVLTAAGQEAEDAWNFGEAHELPWNFMTDTLRGQLAFLRGNFADAERWFRQRPEIEVKTWFSGWADSCLFAVWAETNDDRAWKAWTDRSWKSPLIGQPNHVGAWVALERSVLGLAWLGKKEEVAALRPLSEELVLTGVWAFSYLSPFRTAAGIAAACAGDLSAAEQHHLTAIQQTETAPFRISQPTAREWYATMLIGRNGPGDAAKARVLLGEAVAMYESMGMPFHANRTSGRRATL